MIFRSLLHLLISLPRELFHKSAFDKINVITSSQFKLLLHSIRFETVFKLMNEEEIRDSDKFNLLHRSVNKRAEHKKLLSSTSWTKMFHPHNFHSDKRNLYSDKRLRRVLELVEIISPSTSHNSATTWSAQSCVNLRLIHYQFFSVALLATFFSWACDMWLRFGVNLTEAFRISVRCWWIFSW